MAVGAGDECCGGVPYDSSGPQICCAGEHPFNPYCMKHINISQLASFISPHLTSHIIILYCVIYNVKYEGAHKIKMHINYVITY